MPYFLPLQPLFQIEWDKKYYALVNDDVKEHRWRCAVHQRIIFFLVTVTELIVSLTIALSVCASCSYKFYFLPIVQKHEHVQCSSSSNMSGIWVMCERGSANTPETKIRGHEWAREMTEGCEKWQSDGGRGIDNARWQKVH